MATEGQGDEVTPTELAERIETGEPVDVLDVRNRDEIDAWRIEGPGVGVTHVPYMRFLSASATGDPASLVDDGPYVVVCPEGEASAEVAAMLEGSGVEAVNLAGGMEGWARVYRRDRVAADATAATVHQYRRPATGCLAYAVVSAGEAAVVDPLRAFVDRYREDAAPDAAVEYVLDTHVHADHLSGLRNLAAAADATPLVSEGAAGRGLDGVETVADGDTVAVGDCDLEVLATPGHTTGSASLRVDDLLLSGDSLFLEGAPRPDLQKGDDAAPELAGALYGTLTERLAPLPDRTVVAPGHLPPQAAAAAGPHAARLGDLRERLAAFTEDRGAFVDRVIGSMGEPPANFERVVAVNLGRESVDGATAFELELGPNNCAVGG
jgi:glyoxylase-like metal-dependent hydrolase (beta-lactamase superfamily II)/rhodanese-related sulfurtransferase